MGKKVQFQHATPMMDARPTLPVHGNKEEIQSMKFQTSQHQLLSLPQSQLSQSQNHLLNKNQFQLATHTLIQNAKMPLPVPQSTSPHFGRQMLKLMNKTSSRVTQSATVPSAANIFTQREKMITQSTM